MFKKLTNKNLISLTLLTILFIAGCATTSSVNQSGVNSWINTDTVKARKFDTGKMWTFDYPPVDYFEKEYGFRPSEEWLSDVRMSALKFASWCSSSFVSEDGLVMTNHHCVDFITSQIEKEGEDIKKNGFYAQTLADERKIPGVFVDQLVLIEDVTDEILGAMTKGQTAEEKAKLKEEKIKELQAAYSEDTGLIIKIVPLYSGGRYSLYGYKRYNDVRMVYVEESDMGLYGGDPDNFTYPRYNPDFSFVRVYGEDGKPLKTEHYFKWSTNGPQPGEPLFVVGNPGTTHRLKTMAELSYMRDVTLKNQVLLLGGLKKIYEKMMQKYPEREEQFKGNYFMLANSEKAMTGQLEGLRSPYLWARKMDFEKKFKQAVKSDEDLNSKYGHIWEAIENVINEKKKYAFEQSVYSTNPFTSPAILKVAAGINDLIAEIKSEEQTEEEISDAVDGLYGTKYFEPYEIEKLMLFNRFMIENIGTEHEAYKLLFGSNKGKEAVDFLTSNSLLANKEKVKELLIKNKTLDLTNDPVIKYLSYSNSRVTELETKLAELSQTQKALDEELGQALYAVYGTSIPPDATFTLRISDGVMKKYKYNGTEAPVFTTFYGLYDRYYSHQKKFPWDLPKEWLENKDKLEMETPYNFISTCDIIGGNSGSAVINKNAEVVGVAFDGNIESLPGSFIYSDEANRTVSVASQGIMEVVSKIYSADRLAAELKAGKIPEKYKK